MDTSLRLARARPTAITSAEEEERPAATGTLDSTTPSKPLRIVKRRASSLVGAFT